MPFMDLDGCVGALSLMPTCVKVCMEEFDPEKGLIGTIYSIYRKDISTL